MNGPQHPSTSRVEQSPEQLRYARWLEWGTRAGFVVLVLSFAAYALGVAAPHVPHERLPQLWNQPVDVFLRASGTPTGWGWAALLHRGDMAALLGIAVLAGCSTLCLLSLLPLYWRRGDRAFVVLVLAEVAVIVLAASGWLASGH